MKTLFSILLLCSLRLLAGDLEFENFNNSYNSSYDPFNAAPTVITIPVMVRNNTNNTTDAFITISSGNQNDPNYKRKGSSVHSDDELDYQFYSDKSMGRDHVIRAIPDLQSNYESIIVTNIASGKSKTGNLYFTIPELQYVNSDTYTDIVTIYLYEGEFTTNPESTNLMETVSYFINIDVDRKMLMSLTDTIGGTTLFLDFETIESGESMDFELQFQSNSDFEVYAQSLNQQSLVHKDNNIPSTVGYVLSQGKTNFDLSSGENVLIYSAKTRKNKIFKKTYTISLDDFSLVTAGDYSDVIYLTMQEL